MCRRQAIPANRAKSEWCRRYTQSMNTPKQDLLELLELEPDDVSLDQLIDDFEFAARIRRGLFELQRGCTMTPERLQLRLAIHFMSYARATQSV